MHTDKDFHPFARDADKGCHDPRELCKHLLDAGSPAARMVEVDAYQPAVLLHVGHGMPAEADARRNHTRHAVLDGLCLRFAPCNSFEAAVFFHCPAEAVAPQLVDELRQSDGLCAFAAHIVKFGKPDKIVRCCLRGVRFHICLYLYGRATSIIAVAATNIKKIKRMVLYSFIVNNQIFTVISLCTKTQSCILSFFTLLVPCSGMKGTVFRYERHCVPI